VNVKLTPDKLARGRRWMLRFGEFDLDVEGSGTRAAGARSSRSAEEGTRAPRYQELLYEANRFELADGIAVEVASPEDLEHFSHVRRTGTAPEFRVTRNAEATGPEDAGVTGEADEVANAANAGEAADAQPADAEDSSAAPETAPDA
jgi:hypothetical protein